MISLFANLAKQIGYILFATFVVLACMLLSTYVHVRVRPQFSPMPIYAIWAGLFSAFCFFYRNTLPGQSRFLRYSVIAAVAFALTLAVFSIDLAASRYFHHAIGGR